MSILFSQTSSSLTLSLKLLFISTSVLSAAVLLKLSAPAIADFAVTDVPSIYNVVVSWLRPPYLYLVINCIIVTLVASSKLQSKLGDIDDVPLSPSPTPPLMTTTTTTTTTTPVSLTPQPMVIFPDRTVKHYDFDAVTVSGDPVQTVKLDREEVFQYTTNNFIRSGIDQFGTSVFDDNMDFVDVNPAVKLEQEVFEYPLANNFISNVNVPKDYETKVFKSDKSSANRIVNGAPAPWEPDMKDYEREVVLEKSSPSPSPISGRDSSEFSFSNEKPPVSKRIGHRRAVRSSPEGGKAALGVSKAKRQDTLESTWKTITEGRAMPLARHLKKADTWETHGGRHHNQTVENEKMTKSETFKDSTNTTSSLLTRSSPGSGKLKKEPSLSQDELNRRVEAFIKKFNEDMRLQRQESLKQYTEMINRGAH